MYRWEQEGSFARAAKEVFFWSSGKEMKDYLQRYLGAKRGMGLKVEEILLLSPHREAKDKFDHLLEKVFGNEAARPHAVTLQGFCLEFLNREGYRLGLRENTEVIRGWQEFLILKNLLPELSPQGYDPALWGKNGFIREILGFFNHLWGQGIGSEQLRHRLPDPSLPQLSGLSLIYSQYTSFCRQKGYLPLAAIAPLFLQLLQEYPFLLEKCQGKKQFLIVTDLDQMKPVQLQIIRHLFLAFPQTLGLAFQASPLMKELRAWKSVQLVMGDDLKREKKMQEYCSWEAETWGVAQEIARLLVEERYKPQEIMIFPSDASRVQPLIKVLTAMGIPCYAELLKDTHMDPVVGFLYDYLQALMEPNDNERQMKWLSSPILGLDGLWLRRTFYQAMKEGRQLLTVVAETGTKEPVVSFLHHLEGVKTGSISPPAIVEELYVKYNLFQRFLDSLERGEGRETQRILNNLRDFLLLSRECEHLSRHFKGGQLDLKEFLQQLEGALPYLNVEIIASPDQEVGVMIVPLRDSFRFMPQIAFLPAMAANIYPPQRIPSPLLGIKEWNVLRAYFPHLELTPDLDPHHFFAEHWVTLKRLVAVAHRVWVSWAQSYPDLETTGPSDLLNVNIEKGTPKGFNEEFYFAWPDPEPGATTRDRLGNYYLQQVNRGKTKTLAAEQGESDQFGVENRNIFRLIGEMKIATQVNYFTPSAIRTYLACPRRYYYQNILDLNISPFPRAQLGLLLHRVLGNFHRHFPSLFGVKENVACLYLKEVFAEIWTEMESSFGKGLLSNFYRREAESICRAYLARELPNWEAGRRAITEETLDFTFAGKRLQGRIDRLDQLPGGGWEIIDYKTGRDQTEGKRKREFLPREGERPTDMQLIIYYLGARERGIFPDCLTYYQLSELIGRGKVERSLPLGEGKGCLTPADLQQAENTLTEVLEEMQREDYPPQPRNDRICMYCTFRFPCPGPKPPEEGEENE